MQRLIHSSKFWLLVLDVMISLVLFFTGKYASPTLAEDINFVIGAIQPVFVAIIAGIAYEDGKAGASYYPADQSAEHRRARLLEQ